MTIFQFSKTWMIMVHMESEEWNHLTLKYRFEAGMFSILGPESWEGGILQCNRVGFFPTINNGQ